MKIKIDIKKCIFILLGALAIAGTIYFKKCVLIISFEQLLFGFMKLKGGGASTALFGVIYVIVAFVIISLVLLLPVIDFGKKLVIKIKDKEVQLYPINNIKIYGICLFIFGLLSLINVFKVVPFIGNTFLSNTEIFDDYYVETIDVDITFPVKKKNLIYIYLESMETSNFSIVNGGLYEKSLIPRLEELAINNINFSHSDKLGGAYYSYGTNWTSGAMIAQTAGVPLKVTLNDFGPNSIRFRNVTSIGDILSDNGYNNYLLLGSDASFGSRRAYFANHNYMIYDYLSAKDDGRIDNDYYEWWGYEDSKLFSYAKEMITDISKEDKPFNFTFLTADTHFTDGYMDKSCEEIYDDPYSNAIYCSDSMIYEFVKWLQEQDFYDDTVIIITGDHLTMQNGFYETSFENRNIYNVFINVDVNNKFNSTNRVFTVMDMFPTTIAALGADIEGDRLGLGTNLFSDKDTIPEMMGIDEFNDEISKGSHYYYNYIRK